MKRWQRYLFRKLATIFSFFLLCIFIVYFLVDLSIHGIRFLAEGNAPLLSLLQYYASLFATHLDLFFPLTFVLASLKVLLDLNGRFELTALQMAGLSRRTLLTPFFFFASLLSLLCYANSEWCIPYSRALTEEFKTIHAKKKKGRREHVHAIALPDHSELVYQEFNEGTQMLFDVFWIRSFDDIWHIKALSLTTPLKGYHVDHFTRDKLLEKVESAPEKLLEELPLTQDNRPRSFTPFEQRSLSTLFQESFHNAVDRASVKSYLYHKLLLPLLPFLLLLAVAPSAIQFSRYRHSFLLVSTTLFGFITVKTVFDSLLLLSENQMLSPEIGLGVPMLTLFAFFGYRFAKNLS